jgi:hypothetical protein
MDLRRLVSRALVAGLCASALVAVVALLTGTFGEMHWRVIASSLGFSIFTCTAAAGAALRSRSDSRLRALGTAAAAVSLTAFVLLIAALWIDDSEAEVLWRGFGVAGLGSLWTSHASLMLGALRPGDSPTVRTLSQISAYTLGIETAVGVAAVLDLISDVGEVAPRVLAALIVVTVLTTALAPLLRRMQRTSAPSPAAVAVGRGSGFAAEVAESAQRLSLMDLPAPARAEVDHLRRLARDAGG